MQATPSTDAVQAEASAHQGLRVRDLHAFYGKSHVLHGVHFDVQPGEIVALLGRNGSGRSTTAKAIMGMVDCQGSLLWQGQPIEGRKPYEIAHLGIGYVPDPPPNLRARLLFGDEQVCLVRKGHPVLRRRFTPELYAGMTHVAICRAASRKVHSPI